jgi:signal transduction histidine kinase
MAAPPPAGSFSAPSADSGTQPDGPSAPGEPFLNPAAKTPPPAGFRLRAPWRGLTGQLFLFTILPLTALLLLITFGSLELHHNEMRSLVGERDLRAVRAAASSLSQELEHRGEVLRLLAASLAASDDDSARRLDEWTGTPEVSAFDGGVLLLDDANRPIQTSSAIERLLANFKTPLPDALPPETDPPARFTAPARFSAPIQQKDGTWWQAVVVTTPGDRRLVGLFSPAALVRETVSGIAGGQSSVLLVSADGQALYRYNDSDPITPLAERSGVAEVLRGESGVNYNTLTHHGSHNGEHVVAFSPIPPLNWGLVVEEPWEQTASPLLNATQAAPLVLAPVLALALMALWFGARQIVQPLLALEQRAGRLAGGDFAAIRTPVGGIPEVHNLQDQLIEMADALQAAQEALHSYIGALTAGVETERRSLARELHDDTLQSLIALNQQIQLVLLHVSDPAQRQQLLDLKTRAAEAILSLRRAIGGLRPIYLEDLGLSAALEMLARGADAVQVPDGQRPEVRYQLSGSEHRLSPESELAFYRIAQEALNNAVHHANASLVELHLEFTDRAVRLSIRDNGRGFQVPGDPGAFAHAGHYGLLGMRERADLVGARFNLTAAPGKGAVIRLEQELD